MTEPTEFQRQLSAEIVKSMTGGWFTGSLTAELRRLEAVIAQLLEALEELERTSGQPAMLDDPVRVKARAAIAAAKGEA